MDNTEQRRIPSQGRLELARQAYLLAVFCLVLGVALGYLFRGSASPAAETAKRLLLRPTAAYLRVSQPKRSDSRTAESDGGPSRRALTRDSEDQSRMISTRLCK